MNIQQLLLAFNLLELDIDMPQNDRTGSTYLMTDVEVTGSREDGGLGTDFPIHDQFESLMTELCAENSATFIRTLKEYSLICFKNCYMSTVQGLRITSHSTDRQINNLR